VRPNKWTPTADQAKLFDEALNSGLRRSVTAICQKAGVSRAAFYRWMQDAHFRAAWSELHTEAISRHLPGVTAAVIFQAERGNISAARLLYEVAGALKIRAEVTGKDGGPIEILGARERVARRIAELDERRRAGRAALRANSRRDI